MPSSAAPTPTKLSACAFSRLARTPAGSSLAGDEPAYLDGYGIVDAAHAREIAADADVEAVRAPGSVVPTTYRPGTVLDTWMRVRAGGCEWLHCLLSKSSPAQTFRSLEGVRWRWIRVGRAHRSPMPTAVVGAPGCRTERCRRKRPRWRKRPRRRK
ncbi:hypothetical protein [Rhodococcus jostii]|uniref:hypothetical protein n=1 Tax=Rhodococcus jostii TaxID=132919 RepID=UPI003659574E